MSLQDHLMKPSEEKAESSDIGRADMATTSNYTCRIDTELNVDIDSTNKETIEAMIV